jgi:hypothetical protein
MANAFVIPPAGPAAIKGSDIGSGRTYTTSVRDERSETDPSRSLTMREVAELQWFFCQAEADMGVRSTFGEQLARALGKRASDEARRLASKRRWLLKRTIRGWSPKAASTLEAECLAIGIPIGNRAAATTQFHEQHIYQHAEAHEPPNDPYENDSILFLVRRANMIRRRLERAGSNATKVLNAVYGIPMAGEDRAALRKRFGDLVEIVVALVACQRSDTDAPARSIVRAKLNDDTFITMQTRNAREYLKNACEAYAGTR